MKRFLYGITVLFLCFFLMGFTNPDFYETQQKYVKERKESEIRLHDECVNRLKKTKVVNKADKSKKTYQKPCDLTKIDHVENGKVYANIRCDEIALNTAVYYGDYGDIIEKGVGHYNGSGLPGNGKMILMDSHNNTYFKPLQNIQEGHTIYLETYYGTYQYTVYHTQVFNENDLETYILNHLNDNEEVLLLYTCYPFQKTNYRKTERLVVFAK